jgi:acyl-CoA thioester hydrolase
LSAAAGDGETFRFPLRVYYEDTDAAGVVYYANYLRFMERARTEWLGSLGVEVAELERAHGVVFVVARMEIDYRAPARLGDRLEATLTLVELGRARMVAVQDVRRESAALARARVTLGCIDRASWQPARIPGTLRAMLHGRLEKKS